MYRYIYIYIIHIILIYDSMCVSPLVTTSISLPQANPVLNKFTKMPRGSYHTAGNQLIGCFYEGVTLTIADPMTVQVEEMVFSIENDGFVWPVFFEGTPKKLEQNHFLVCVTS